MEEAAEAAAPFYAAAEVITTLPPALTVIPASGLQYGGIDADIPAGSDMKEQSADTLGQMDLFAEMGKGDGKAVHSGSIDRILDRAGLEAADFGTIVHGFLEGRFRGAAPQIPPRIQARLEDSDLAIIHEAAEAMARGFLDSGIGKLSLGASYRESEFPIITLAETGTNREVNEVDRGSTGAGKIPITGQIDLLFEWEGIMHIVDFKTDRVEQPEQHFGQLAVYQRAVSDIFEKPARSWIFYLRSSNTVELTEKVRDIDIEAMVEAYAGMSRA
jgi:ATP-dependent exoDNAse (exonuclease V) beta subunit